MMYECRCSIGGSVVLALLLTCARPPAAPGQYVYDPGDFATSVIEYVQGEGVGSDWINGEPYTDAATALGRPTVDTTGDGWSIPLEEAVPVVYVYSPIRSFEIVTVGNGGRLVMIFDHAIENHPRNPYGVDFILFGNAFSVLSGGGYWTNRDPDQAFIAAGDGFIDPGDVSVSQDGLTWYTFSSDIGPHADPVGPFADTDGPYADVFAPTLGRVYDPDAPDVSIGAWNEWWAWPTDPTWPMDPRMTWSDFSGSSIAEAAMVYEQSAGGTGFDLEWLEVPDLEWIQYVRIDGPAEGSTPEVDAVSDVFAHLGDFDQDGDLDLKDFAAFQGCFTGPGGQRRLRDCFPADFDANLVEGDMDVDLDDFELFFDHLSGPMED